MKLAFIYPDSLNSLELFLATKAYESIWQSDETKIHKLFKQYTGLEFQQDEIDVIVHDGQSMSGKDGVPMRLNIRNDTLTKQRNALVHELAHRLLFGNGLYTPRNNNPIDNDEIRVLLFQGDVIRELYGEEDYLYWASVDTNSHTKEHIQDMLYVLSLSEKERHKLLQKIVATIQ